MDAFTKFAPAYFDYMRNVIQSRVRVGWDEPFLH